MSSKRQHRNKKSKALPLGKGLGWDSIYFIGIGGIGMSALARYFHVHNFHVSGYDKTASPITKSLEDLGISIHFNDSVDAISTQVLDKEKTLIVYTPAVPKEHNELNYFIEHNYTIYKRSEILGEITKNTFCFAVLVHMVKQLLPQF